MRSVTHRGGGRDCEDGSESIVRLKKDETKRFWEGDD